MRSHAVLGKAMHILGTNLHFKRQAVLGNDDGMQRPIPVGLGAGDVIIKLAGNRFPSTMHHVKRRIAVRDTVHNDPKRAQILNTLKRARFRLHFLVNAVEVLGPAKHLGINALGR